ncbi:hypothetical protein FKM82_029335 [Ascaphus truei]
MSVQGKSRRPLIRRILGVCVALLTPISCGPPQPLSDRLDTFSLDPSLVTKHASLVRFPPDFQPVPCKPLFFDLALNHVTLPSLEDKLEQKSKSGLTGYIKGIFGFRS